MPKPGPVAQRSLADMNRRLEETFQKHGIPASGTITAVQPNATGGAQTFTVQLDGGMSVPDVRPSGRAGEGVGARVNLLGYGGHTATSYEITAVTEPYPGYTGNDHQMPLSTPVIAQVTSAAEIGDDGTVVLAAHVTMYCIAEHYNHRLPTTYEVQIRDVNAGGNPDALPIIASPTLERIAGQLPGNLSAGDSSFTIEIQSVPDAPTFDFLRSKIIVGIEDELIFVPDVIPTSPTVVLLNDATRGYLGVELGN